MKKFWIWSPLTLLLLLLVAFVTAFISGRDPSALPSALLDRAAPQIQITDLYTDKKYDQSVFAGKLTLVNFFASWCVPCRIEHPILLDLKNQGKLQMVGIVFQDSPQNIRDYIKKHGNPFDVLFVPDPMSTIGLDWGLAGVPETYIVDQGGVIRYRIAGGLDEEAVKTIINPLIKRLGKESR